jgi:hypothetical protein
LIEVNFSFAGTKKLALKFFIEIFWDITFELNRGDCLQEEDVEAESKTGHKVCAPADMLTISPSTFPRLVARFPSAKVP